MPVGKNTLAEKMKQISLTAKCSRTYTNHCLRATTVTTLDRNGFEARHIMGVSGHKSESSIRSYSRVCEDKKREMSRALSTQIQGSPRPSTSTDIHNDVLQAPTSPRLSSSQEERILNELINSPIVPVNVLSNQEVKSSNKTINYNFHSCVVNIHNQ